MNKTIPLLVSCIALTIPALGNDEGFSLSVKAGAEYDSNITISETDVTTNQGDIAALIDVALAYKTKANENISLEFGYDFSQSLYETETGFNMQNHGFTANADTEVNGFDLGLAYGYYNIGLGGNAFMSMHTLNPNIALFFGEGSYIRADYTFLKKSFVELDTRDANSHSIGASFYQFMKGGSFFNLGLGYEKENTLSDEFDYAGLNTSFSYVHKLTLNEKQTEVTLSVKHQDRNYQNITESIAAKRDDKRTTFSVKVAYPIIGKISLVPEYKYISASSNFESADYKEHVIGAMLGYTF